MIKLCISGKVDKRIITYPLIRACGIAGKTMVITNDITYKRLYYGYDDVGEIGGILIRITNAMEEDALEAILEEANELDVEYIIYISDKEYTKGVNKAFILCEYHIGFMKNYMEERSYEDPSITFGVLTLQKVPKEALPKNCNVSQLLLRPEYSLYIHQMEEKKELLTIPDKKLLELISLIFAEAMNLKSQDLYKLLKRKDHNKRSEITKG